MSNNDERTYQVRRELTEFAGTLDVPPFVQKINELVNNHLWKQAAAREKQAMIFIGDLWEVVQKVAATDTTYPNDTVIKARALVAQQTELQTAQEDAWYRKLGDAT
jgi:hypothetical protein